MESHGFRPFWYKILRIWYAISEKMIFLQKPQHQLNMTNDEFRAYLRNKYNACCKDIEDGKLTPDQLNAAKEAKGLLESSIKIMNNSAGSVCRRYKRDYLRRLQRAGVEL